MPAASLMRLASTAFSLQSARKNARRAAARGRPAAGRTRPRQSLKAAFAQPARASRGPSAG